MKNRIKLVIAMAVLVIAFLVVIIIASISAIDKITIPEIDTLQTTITNTIEPTATNTVQTQPSDYSGPKASSNNTVGPIQTAKPSSIVIPTPTINPNAPTNTSSSFAEITIRTERKTRTYDIMADVNERTLKKT